MRRLFRQFSTPGGIPSHVSAPTPGSIHEGGELGYVLTHAFGAVFDDPDLIAIAVVGDGEAETGPLEGSWKGITYLNPARDGAVLPILHLNGYKISSATVLGRSSDAQVRALLDGHGYEALFVEGNDPPRVHQALAAALDGCLERVRRIQKEARTSGVKGRPRWPALVLRTPKGWTGPDVVDGVQVQGTFRAHQVPLSGVRDNPEHLKLLESWMRSYRPAELFDAHGSLVPELRSLAPRGDLRMSANPRTSGETCEPLKMPPLEHYAVKVEAPAARYEESTRRLGQLMRDLYRENPGRFRLFCPDETNSNRLGAVFETSQRAFMLPVEPTDDTLGPDGRVMEVLSEHNCEGWLEGYILTGRHGLFATYEAFAMVVASMAIQHSKWLDESLKLEWRKPVPSLNVLLTSTCWRNDHNGFSHQGPGFIDAMLTRKPTVSRIYLPPDANCLLWTAHHCFRHPAHVNVIVIDKQPQLQYLDLEAAHRHCQRGASVWEWASNDEGDPDIVMACAGDVPTMETLAATWLLRTAAPGLRIRVVNLVDLMSMFTPEEHPHGMDEQRFVELFTRDRDVVFAFHGYPLRNPPHAPRAAERRALPRARLSRAGHHHHPVRHGGAQRDQPVPPGHRGAQACTAHPRKLVPAGRAVPGGAGAAPGVRRGAPRGHARGARLDLDPALNERRSGYRPTRARVRRGRALRRAAARVGPRGVFRRLTISRRAETGRLSSTGWRKGRSARTR